jgi:hypothetical protein
MNSIQRFKCFQWNQGTKKEWYELCKNNRRHAFFNRYYLLFGVQEWKLDKTNLVDYSCLVIYRMCVTSVNEFPSVVSFKKPCKYKHLLYAKSLV